MNNWMIGNQRISSQRIEENKFAKPEEVVKWMGAMQAQNYNQALWAIGQRLQSSNRDMIEQAIAEKKIVRTWPMRGTLHFVASEDVRWMVKLSAERMMASNKRRLKELELDQPILERCKVIFYETLKDGIPASRPFLLNLLEEAGISTKNQRGPFLLWYASQTGQICQGPMLANQPSFVLIEQWAPQAKNLLRDEALFELAKRYFFSHGPATIHDFSWWSGLTVADAKRGLEAVQSELISYVSGIKEYWMAPDQAALRHTHFHLLPSFDEYLLGYKDRNAVLPDQHSPKVIPGKNGVFLPIIVANSQVIGTWKRSAKKSAAEISFSLFEAMEKHQEEQAAQAAETFSRFLGLPLASLDVHDSL